MKISKYAKELIKLATRDRFIEKEGDKWCVLCALANATSTLKDKHPKFQMSVFELLSNLFKITPKDAPLVEARDYLESLDFELLFNSKKAAKEFMLKSIK